MNPQDLRTLHLLEELEKNSSPSQRQLARQLNISVGLVNSFIKRLANKGYFKITHIPKNRVKYLLTPKGAAEKTRLTYEYIKYSYGFYREARKKLYDMFKELQSMGIKNLVFAGATDLAEIAYLTMQRTEIDLVAVIDDTMIGKKFLKHTVKAIHSIDSIDFDRILITSTDSLEGLKIKLKNLEIDYERILMIQ